MGKISSIEWTDSTWNPWRGCKKVSAGCKNCYMFWEQRRYGRDPRRIVRSKTTFNAPLKWHEPKMIFTCSWSDFFITDADIWRPEAWDIIRQTPHHTYQILTKRPENIVDRLPSDWGSGWPNVWLGVTVENRVTLERIDILLDVNAQLRFLSMEPLLESVDLGLRNWPPEMLVDWIIVGGESGPGARPINPDWVRLIRDDAAIAGVPFFFKQWGGVNKKKAGRMLDGRIYDEMPFWSVR